MQTHPYLINGNNYIDERGEVGFINDLTFQEIKRFYWIKNHSENIIRAWQGHKIEKKYFVVMNGTFLICTVKIDNWDNPSHNLEVDEFVLSSKKQQVLCIPPDHANGFKALEPDSKLIVFSNLSLSDSQNDLYRFDQSLWFDWSGNSN